MADSNPNLQDSFKTILQAGINAIGGQGDKASDFVDHVLSNVQIPEQFKNTVEDLAGKGQDALKNADVQGVLGNLSGMLNSFGEKAKKAASGVEKDISEVVGNVKADVQSGDAHKAVMDTLDKLDKEQLAEVAEKAHALISKLTQGDK